MLANYVKKQTNPRKRSDKTRVAIAFEQEGTDNAEHFVNLVKQFTEITELTDEIVATFIEKVQVHAAKMDDGKKPQEITVYYNFIGNMN